MRAKEHQRPAGRLKLLRQVAIRNDSLALIHKAQVLTGPWEHWYEGFERKLAKGVWLLKLEPSLFFLIRTISEVVQSFKMALTIGYKHSGGRRLDEA